MPSVVENDGKVLWGKEVTCPECGEEFESFDPHVPEGGYEICEECAGQGEA